MASFTITPLTDHTGVEVIGLDFTQPIDTETHAVLRRAFAEHHVLVMRDQHFTPDQFKAAVQLFGEVQPHDKKEHHVPGHPGVDYVSNDEIVDGRRIIPGETFHTDHSNHPRPPKATTLFAVELPSSGGDTQYVNMHDAFDGLPEDTKQKSMGSRPFTSISVNTVRARSVRSARKVAATCRCPVSTRWCARIPRMAARRCSSIRCAWNQSSTWRIKRRWR